MKDSSLEALNKELHPHAEQVAKEYVDGFAASLLLQAKMLAFQENADLVLSNHIEDARQIISRERKRRWSRRPVSCLRKRFVGCLYPRLHN